MQHEGVTDNRGIEMEPTLPRATTLSGGGRALTHRHRLGKHGPPDVPSPQFGDAPSFLADFDSEREGTAFRGAFPLRQGSIFRGAFPCKGDHGAVIPGAVTEPFEHGGCYHSDGGRQRQRNVDDLPRLGRHEFLLSVNRVQVDRGAAVRAAVSHSTTQFTAELARQRVLGGAV